MSAAAIADALHRGDVEQPNALRLIERVPQRSRAQDLREVEKRASDRGDRDPVTLCSVVRMQVSNMMQRKAGPTVTTPTRVDDVHRSGDSGAKLPECSRVAVAQ